MKLTDEIIKEFRNCWLDTEIGAAEVAYSRFMAGEVLPKVAWDYDKTELAIQSALRFFILKERRNKKVLAVYEEMRHNKLGNSGDLLAISNFGRLGSW